MDEFYMRQAIKIAKISTYDVPVGAIIVYKDKIIGQGYNTRELTKDPTAHAEMMAIKEASAYLGGWRLVDCTLYVTLEPCAMCAGAIVNARIPRLVIGAKDARFGCCGSVLDLTNNPKLNHRVDLTYGVLEEECSALLKEFFKDIRKRRKKKMKFIDLRSDTVTMPTEEMRKAMMDAEVGDDVYEDDPTVKRLEKLAAEMTGKEASLFVTSGTMGNQIAIMTHTTHGDEIIANRKSHIVIYEVGSAARLSGVNYSLVDNPDGYIYGKDVAERIRHEDIHYPKTSLLCLENALSDGRVVPLELMKEASDVAREHGVAVHLDGARLFNAALALGLDAKELAKHADSVMFCLSKGLCAPVGSMLCGTSDFIEKARRMRKVLGGGMRQAGVIAAPGIIALEVMTKRLQEDHDNAKYLAEKLLDFPTVELDKENVQINMVFFSIKREGLDTDKFTNYLLENGVKINSDEDNNYRFVTTNDINRADIDKVLDLMKEYLK